MLLGSRWNSCELDDVKACHILRPKAPWISLNTVFVSHATANLLQNRHKPQDVKDGAVYWNHKAGGLCYQNHERIMEISSYNLHCGQTILSC